ncbi:putative transferase, chloroplastic [Glycine soja]|uniref:Putative transferase, chloroplastic n=1 Tax=Glycine soja TaxID=3848 RepID=A0A445JDU9_GLYSO|nr:putative transferase, chloroplastic [Glycine soja]
MKEKKLISKSIRAQSSPFDLSPPPIDHDFLVDKQPVTLGVGNIISEDGFSLLMSPGAAPSIWKAILSQGAIPMGSNAWNKLRFIREPGSIITVDEKKLMVGKLTSYTSGRKQSEHFGLGYIKRRAASEGDTVIVRDNIKGTVVEAPFLSQLRPPSAS